MASSEISKEQIAEAYKVLSELQAPWSTRSSLNYKSETLDTSNGFFTIFPRDFGMPTPTLLDDINIIEGAFSEKFCLLITSLKLESLRLLRRFSYMIPTSTDREDHLARVRYRCSEKPPQD